MVKVRKCYISMTPKEKEKYKKNWEAIVEERQIIYDEIRSEKPYDKLTCQRAQVSLSDAKRRVQQLNDPIKYQHRMRLDKKNRERRTQDPKEKARRLKQQRKSNKNMTPEYHRVMYQRKVARNLVWARRKSPCVRCGHVMMNGDVVRHMKVHERQDAKLKGLAPEKCSVIERNTIPTADFKAWAAAHLNTISGSIVRRVANLRADTDPSSVIKMITLSNFTPSEFTGLAAADRGNKVEGLASEWYERVFPDRIVEKCGCFVLPAMPLFLSTPDMLISTNSAQICGEVKCPLALKLENVKWLEKVKGQWRLKVQHAYYDQVCMHLLCTGMECCDVIVYISPFQFFIRRYYYNDMSNRMTELLTKGIRFYCDHVTKTPPPPVPGVKSFPPSPKKPAYCSSSTLRIDKDPFLCDDAIDLLTKQLKVEQTMIQHYENRNCKLFPNLKAMEGMVLTLLGRDAEEVTLGYQHYEEEEDYDSVGDRRLMSDEDDPEIDKELEDKWVYLYG